MDQEQRVLDYILSQTDKLYHAELEQRLPPGFLEFLRTTPKSRIMEQIYYPQKVVNLPKTYSLWQNCLAVSRILYNSASRSDKRKFEILARQTLRDLRYATMDAMQNDLNRELFVLEGDEFSEPSTSTVTIPRSELAMQDKKGEELEKRLDALLEYKLRCPCPVGSCCSTDEMTTFEDVMEHFNMYHPICSLFVCSYCEKGHPSYVDLQEHECTGFNGKDMAFCRAVLACSGCGQHFTLNVKSKKNEDNWKQFCHFMINHNSSKMMFVKIYSSSRFGVRSTVRLEFLPSYAKHLKNHCDECDVPMQCVGDLRDHCHSGEMRCCERLFPSKMDLLRHIGQKHVDKRYLLAEYLQGAESRTFFGISTSSNRSPKSPVKFADLPSELDSMENLIKALRGPSKNKITKVKVFSLDERSNIVSYLKNGFTLKRVEQNIPNNELADEITLQFQEETQLILEPLKEHQRLINCFKRTTFCGKCYFIANSDVQHSSNCSAISNGEVDNGMVKILLEENSLPNTSISCPHELCEERCCSLNGLQSHLALQHGIKATLKMGNALGVEYPVTDTAFTKEVNLTCFLTKDGKIPDEEKVEPMNENNLNRSTTSNQSKTNWMDDVITIDDDEPQPIDELPPPVKRRKVEDSGDESKDNKENNIDQIIGSMAATNTPATITCLQTVAHDFLGPLASLDKTCPYCGLYFTDDEYLGKHILSHPEFTTSCKICNILFKTIINLVDHQNEAHTLRPALEQGMDQFLLCAFCSVSLPRSTMFSHQIYECRNVINCGICGISQKGERGSSADWAIHMIEKHPSEFGRFGCVCQRSFSHFSMFMQHLCQNPSPELRTAKITNMMEHLDYIRLECPQLKALLHVISQNGAPNVSEPRMKKRPTPPEIRKRSPNSTQSKDIFLSPMSDTRSEPARSSPVPTCIQAAEQVPEEELLCPPETVQIIERPASCSSGDRLLRSSVSSGPAEWTATGDSDDIMVFSEVTHEERNFKCTNCSRKFHKEKQLKRHIANDHRNDCKDILCEKDFGLPKTGNFYICHREATAFGTIQQFNKHRESHKDETHECTHCTIITINRVTLEKHMETRANTIFMCVRCKPNIKFKEEWLLYEHLRNTHRADLVYYCKGCKMATCEAGTSELFFHIKYNFCGKLKYTDELRSDNMGICPASDITYQPIDAVNYEEKIKQNPDAFTTPTACSHRSFARHADHFTTCPEIHYAGSEQCFGLVPHLRYVNLLQSIANGGEISVDEIFRNAVLLGKQPCPYTRIKMEILGNRSTTVQSSQSLTNVNSLVVPRRKRKTSNLETARTPTATAFIQPGRVFTDKEIQAVQDVLRSPKQAATMTPAQIAHLEEIVARQPGAARAQSQTGMVSQPTTSSTIPRRVVIINPAITQGVPGSVQNPANAQGVPGSVQNPANAQGVPGSVQNPANAQGVPGSVQNPANVQGVPGSVQNPANAQGVPGSVQNPANAQGVPGSVQNPAVQSSSMPPPASRPVQPPIGDARNRFTAALNQTQQQIPQPKSSPRTLAEALRAELGPQQTAVVLAQGRPVAPQRQMPHLQPNQAMLSPSYHQYPAGTRMVQNEQMLANVMQAQQAYNQQIQYQRTQVARPGFQIQTQGPAGQRLEAPANANQNQVPVNQFQPWPHRFHCSMCGLRFVSEDEIFNHMLQQHGLNPVQDVSFKLKCPLGQHCGNNTVFEDVQKFRKHINTAHADNFAYHSSDCGTRFHMQEKAQQHEAHHMEGDVGCCYLCGKNGGWKTFAEKKRHYLIHCLTSRNHFGCTICRKNCQSEAHYVKHFEDAHRNLLVDNLNARENYKFMVFYVPESFELEVTPLFLYYLGLKL